MADENSKIPSLFFDKDYILGYQFEIKGIEIPLKEIEPEEDERNRIDFNANFTIYLFQFDYDYFEKNVGFSCVCSYEILNEILRKSGQNGKIVEQVLNKRITYINSFPEEYDLEEIKVDDLHNLYISDFGHSSILKKPEVLRNEKSILCIYIQNDTNAPHFQDDDLRIETIENTEVLVKFLQEYEPKDSYERKRIKMYLQSLTA